MSANKKAIKPCVTARINGPWPRKGFQATPMYILDQTNAARTMGKAPTDA